MNTPARYWHRLDDAHIQCELCPRRCRLKEGQRAFCFVREMKDDQMVLSTYGRSTGFCIDPIEKKPLNHFLPGTPVLSFGTAGCNLGCRFCQNWDISKSREVARLSEEASPETIAESARSLGCRSIAFTYNDPVIWAEYAIDTANAAHALGLKTVAVTAGYITEAARGDFFSLMDAANIDLKAFTQQFYHKLCFADLGPVLDTLEWVHRESLQAGLVQAKAGVRPDPVLKIFEGSRHTCCRRPGTLVLAPHGRPPPSLCTAPGYEKHQPPRGLLANSSETARNQPVQRHPFPLGVDGESTVQLWRDAHHELPREAPR